MAQKKVSSKPLAWFDENLANMINSLEREKTYLQQQMRVVVRMEEDIICLRNLLSEARSKGKEIPVNWREHQFKGRR